MKLSVALIVYELKKSASPPELVYTELFDEHAYISGIRTLCAESFKEDVLYIASSEADLNGVEHPKKLFVCGLPQTVPLSGVIYVNLSVYALINAIESIFYSHNEIEVDLLSAIARNEPLKTVLSISARFFNNPVTVSDLRMRFIETSDNIVRDEMPEYFKIVLDTGYIDIRIVQSMKKRGLDVLLNKSSETFLIDLEDIPVRFFSKNIYDAQQITACVVIHEVFSPIDRAQIVLVDQVAQIVENYAFKNPRGKSTSMTRFEQIIHELFKGSKYNDDIQALYLNQLNWGVDDGYYLIKIQVNSENLMTRTAKYTFGSAHSYFPGSLIIEEDEQATIVVCLSQVKYDFKSALTKLELYLAERHDKGIVSRCFQSFRYIYEHFVAINLALELGPVIDPDKHLYLYGDYSLPVMLKLCGHEIDIRVFCMYEALKIYDHDKANNSEFFKSIYVYLKHNRSLAGAANELKIHRNTLLYRLGRVEELAGIDPYDDSILIPMLLSYEILHYRLKIEDTRRN